VKRSKTAFKVDMGTWFFVPGESEDDRRIIELFDAFQYDVKEPQHWRWLLKEFADQHFGQKSRGRPTKWTKAAYTKIWCDLFLLEYEPQLGRDGIIEFSRKEMPRATRAKASLLKKTHPLEPLYKNSSVDEIYKNLLKANDAYEEEIWQSIAASIKESDPDADVDWLKPPPKKMRANK
jgi:hypothetical protein